VHENMEKLSEGLDGTNSCFVAFLNYNLWWSWYF